MEHPPLTTIPDRLVKIENLENASRKVSNTRYNHILFITDVKKSELAINMNQKIKKVVYNNCEDCQLQTLDSAVIGSRTAEFINVKNCTILFDEVDVRLMRFYNCEGITIQFSDSETLIENFRFYWKNCKNNKVQRTVIRKGTDPNKHRILPVDLIKSFNVPDTQDDEVLVSFLEEGKELRTAALEDKQNPSYARTAEVVLEEMRVAEENNKVFDDITDKQLGELYEKEIEEFEDPPEVFAQKVKQIADALRQAKHAVVYTGAGISTAASLPDYRGPKGVWTMRSKGATAYGKVELGDAKPTYAHYALMELMRKDVLKFITSTNLDGLHRKTGVPANKISEQHGNCYREICGDCDREYLRSFDTLTTRGDRWSHFTGRLCACGGKLKDTIVHFTETVPTREWDPAVKNARLSDVALVMGTSMNVQPAASLPDKSLANGGKLFIVNLQRTPYDEFATIKVHAKTDEFMLALMTELGLTEFDTTYDAVEEMAEREEREEQIKMLKKAAAVVLLAAAGAFAAFRFYKLRK